MKGEGGRVRGHLGDLQRHVASLILQPATLVLQQRVQKVRTLKDHKQIKCSDLSPLSFEAVCRQSRTLKNQPQNSTYPCSSVYWSFQQCPESLDPDPQKITGFSFSSSF